MVATSMFYQTAAQDTNSLKRVWNNLSADSCPLTYNFHLHTVCSDGQLEPLALMQQAVKFGLKGLAITDHHSIRGYRLVNQWLTQLIDLAPQKIPHLWTGVEITSNLQGVEVHILGYGFDPEHLAIQPYLQGIKPEGIKAQAKVVINSIHQAGGLAVLAHPARYRRPAEQLIPWAAHLQVDGVEAYYAYNNPTPWQPSPVQTKQVKQLATQYNLLTTCGTDTHGLDLRKRL